MREGWLELDLSEVAFYVKTKIEAETLNAENYISADNMIGNVGGITKSEYVPQNGKSSYFVRNDILVSNIRPYFKKMWFATFSGGCSNDVFILRVKDESVDSKFLFYRLSSQDFFDFMMAGANGTKMPRGNKNAILNFKVTLPPLETQKKIASILSGYDDLIENNLKRIKILEEMAQQTYEEWFVRMRFPGHETTEINEDTGLPEGWKKVKLKNIADINKTNLKKGFSDNIKYIDIASVSPNQIGKLTEYDFEDAPGRARRVVKNGDIIWSCVRPNRRSHALIINPEQNLIASTGFCVISSVKVPFVYLYHSLITDEFVGYLTNLAGGAAYPAVSQNHFEDSDIILPTNKLLEEFDSKFGTSKYVINKLQNQNQRLREARDLLLPRLMMGMVDV